jgi:hypothetical protein
MEESIETHSQKIKNNKPVLSNKNHLILISIVIDFSPPEIS